MWLREFVGVDFFTNSASVSFNGDYDTITDAGLVHLSALTQLQRLAIERAPVTDAGLEHVKNLTRLQWLYLDGTQITDVGMDFVARLTESSN